MKKWKSITDQDRECCLKNSNGQPFLVKYVDFFDTRLVDSKNQFFPKIDIKEAKQKASEAGLDLVCFSMPSENELAFCKIVNFEKWKYENEKKKKKQRREGKRVTKEIRFSMVISDHDVGHKIKQANGFLDDGDDVIFSMRLKGRQKAYFSDAEARMNEIVEKCLEHGQIVNTRKTHDSIVIRLNKKKEGE